MAQRPVISIDLIYLILGFVDLDTLGKCSEVCKSWKSLIKTPSFCKFWCSKGGCKQPCYITASGPNNQGDHYGWNWNASTGHFLSFRLPSIYKKFSRSSIVASAGGLLCFHLQDDDRNESKRVQLQVGNPVTGVWKDLPLLTWSFGIAIGYLWTEFRMVTYEGGFKVCMQVLAPVFHHHLCYVYDSATDAWVSSSSPYSQAYIKADEERRSVNGDLMPMEVVNAFYYDLTIVTFYDMMRDEWSRGKVRSLKLTTGFERSDGEDKTCVLHLNACTFRMWEYKGEQYLASPWLFAGGWAELKEEANIDGFGVWKVDEEGCLVLVSARRDSPEFYEELGYKGAEYMEPAVQTEAEGNLVCFSNDVYSPFVTYNIDTGSWVGFAINCDGFKNERNSNYRFKVFRHCDRHSSQLEANCKRHSAGFLYRPSLRPL